MSDMTREQVSRLVEEALKKYGLDRLPAQFAVEHNVPRGTHKADAVIKDHLQTAVAKPTGGATVDAEARTALGKIIDALASLGLFRE